MLSGDVCGFNLGVGFVGDGVVDLEVNVVGEVWILF